MRVYLGASIRFKATELVPQDFAGCRLVHIEGYTLYNMTLCETAMSFGKRAKALVSFDLGSFELVRTYREEIISLMGKYVDIVFCNEEEALMLTGYGPERAVSVLAMGCKVAVVTCGADGFVSRVPSACCALSLI